MAVTALEAQAFQLGEPHRFGASAEKIEMLMPPLPNIGSERFTGLNVTELEPDTPLIV